MNARCSKLKKGWRNSPEDMSGNRTESCPFLSFHLYLFHPADAFSSGLVRPLGCTRHVCAAFCVFTISSVAGSDNSNIVAL